MDTETKLQQLESELEEYRQLFENFSESQRRMINIIGKEIKRLEELSNKTPLDKDDIKKFDTLVKDYDLLRKDIKKKLDETPVGTEEEIVNNLLKLVCEDNG